MFQQYLVVGICDETSNSPFPTKQYGSFANYFRDKYNCHITRPEQPLLLVKPLSQRLNCLKPRSLAKRSRDSHENKDEDFTEQLPPELCVKQEFPSDLWIQALLLPSILHRLKHVLQADELRRTISEECGFVYGQARDPLCLDSTAANTQPSLDDSTSPEHVSQMDGACQDFVPPPRVNEDFLAKKLESEYPWLDTDEPVDIERAIHLTLMDIQIYEQFISESVPDALRIPQQDKKAVPAITYSLPPFKHRDIGLVGIKNNSGPDLCEMYKALTTLKANDIVNFERLETLGDTFLKLTASLHIYIEFPEFDEGRATETKGAIVSNKHLYYCAVSKDLAGFIKNNDLSPRQEWLPPGYCLPELMKNRITSGQLEASSVFELKFEKQEQISGLLHVRSVKAIEDLQQQIDPAEDSSYESTCMFFGLQMLPDKTVADCVEALLGAYISSCGMQGGLKLIEWFHILPQNKRVTSIFESELPNPIQNPKAGPRDVDKHLSLAFKIQEVLKYKFNNRAYLLQALTHPSYTPNRVTYSYQKLEFLGDAVLDFLITCYIYENCGNLSPGELTDLRSALVNNVTFAGFAVRLGLHKFLLQSSIKLQASMDSFYEFQESKDFVIDDAVQTRIQESDIDMAEHADVPKVSMTIPCLL